MQEKLKNDKLKIGKYEFDSRFILGSGKYSLELIKSAIEEAKAQIITLALRRANTGKLLIYLIISLKISHFYPTLQAQETPKKPYALQGFQESLVVENLSR